MESSQPDPHQVRVRILVYALVPVVLLLADLPLHRTAWHGNAELHTVIESVATEMGLIAGAMALVRYYTKKSSAFLLLGSAYLGAGLFDGYHAIITSSFFAGRVPTALSSLVPWSGIASRVFLSLMLCASLLAWKGDKLRLKADRKAEVIVYLLAGIWMGISFLCFALIRLPSTYYPDFLIHRPTELGPGLFFGVAAVGYLRKGTWKSDDFEHWLVLSLLLVTSSQLIYTCFYRNLYDPLFFASHLMKIAGYLCGLVGLFISMHSIFKSEAKNSTNLLHTNLSLAAEIDRRERIEEELRQAHDELEGRVRARTADLAGANQALQTEVTDRIRAEETLSAERTMVRALIDNVPDFMYAKDTESRFLVANSFLADSLGTKTPEEMLGKTDFDYYPKELARAYYEDEQNVIRTGQALFNREEACLDGQGNKIWLLTTKVPLRDKNGRVIGIAGTGRDITERKKAETEMQRARQAAEAASHAKSEFLANMSHEIRTPLNGVIGMTDLALDTDLSSDQREYLETVKLSADTLLTVINDILDFSKIEAGKIDLEATDFDLRDSLEGTMKTLGLRADEKGLELLCEVAPEVPEVVRGDSTRLRQIVINLAGNAIKFTPEGEVALKVHVEAQDGASRLLHFTVSDTGVGIAPEKHKLIFDPFSQADSSTTRNYGGTGLGLTISARLVAMMGGTIWVESEVGRGTQFHFTVRMESSENAIQIGTVAPPEVLHGVRVLVVDDNRTNRRILEGMLKRWKMRSTAVEGGEEALVQLAAARQAGEPYSLILTDMHMPKMDGFTLIERIRQRPELSAATIMMLTSAGHRGDAARCEELGVSAYLLKPIRQSELREAIARVLGARAHKGAIPLITRYSLQDARDPAAVLRLLLVEDNQVNKLLAVRLLEKRGHHVVVAGNGREALAALEKENFDLVLMDVQMPEMDGFEATAAIRDREKGTANRQPVVAMTAHAMKGDRERCLAAGMDGYLSKPIRPQELDNVLEQYVAIRQATANSNGVPEPSKTV